MIERESKYTIKATGGRYTLIVDTKVNVRVVEFRQAGEGQMEISVGFEQVSDLISVLQEIQRNHIPEVTGSYLDR
jgi:carbon monoxide dehydrogenase subunit G